MGHRDAWSGSLNSPGPLCCLEGSAGNLQETPRRRRCGFTWPVHPRRFSPILPLASHRRARSVSGAEISTPLTSPPVVTVRPASLSNTLSRTILPLGPLVASCRWPGAGAGRPAQASCQNADARPSGRLSLTCPCRLSARPRTWLRFVLPSLGLAVAAGLR